MRIRSVDKCKMDILGNFVAEKCCSWVDVIFTCNREDIEWYDPTHYTPSAMASGWQIPRPLEISRSSGDVFPNTPLLLTVYGYIYILFGQIVLSVNLLSAIYCCNISLKVATVQREHWTMYAWNIWQVLGIPHFCNFLYHLVLAVVFSLGWHTWF